MIVCPNCNHQNPDGANQCEACYTPLPTTTHCPNCDAVVQTDASFCGQCGYSLQNAPVQTEEPVVPATAITAPALDVPELMPPEPLIQPEPLVMGSATSGGEAFPNEELAASSVPPAPPVPPAPQPLSSATVPSPVPEAKTQLQVLTAKLLHLRTNTTFELPPNLMVIHLGKPNDRIPPDIDVSGFPDSEVVSRIHADIRVEGDAYYIEDVGSSNGTYINNIPLPLGNRHRLRPGDRISLGKGDRVTFLFQMTE